MSSSSAPPPGWPYAESPFHAAELSLQERFGWREKLDAGVRRVLRTVLVDQHRTFFAQLPFVLISSVDPSGQPWASMLVGNPGFAASPDPSLLNILALPGDGDPLAAALRVGAPVGVLGIELKTRRRNRMNGLVASLGPTGFGIRVEQSYGNCPQYIQGRELRFVEPPAAKAQAKAVERGSELNASDIELLQQADTFFIASAHLGDEAGVARGADVSHRGGRPGFIRIDDEQTITTPDFVGNYFFNTLGNLAVQPRAGLLFVDFARGDLLLVAARSEIIWDGPEVEAFAGAQRLVRFHILEVIRLVGILPVRGSSGPDYARELVGTGTWKEAAQVKAAKREHGTWHPFLVRETRDESSTVRSFLLEPAAGGFVAPYHAGQFLPIRLPTGAVGGKIRTYTLSDASDGRQYRISVKREGEVSRWLHDHAGAGTAIEAQPPRGSFVFHPSTRPVVFLSAGIGITPMIAMLNSLLVNDDRSLHPERILFIYGARNSDEHPFAAQLRHKAAHHSNLQLHVAYTAPRTENELGKTHDSVGRIERSLLKTLLPSSDVDVYLCGPTAFTQEQYDSLIALGVPDAQIHFESFGPSSLRRKRAAAPRPAERAGVGSSLITFALSKSSVCWTPEAGSLLDLAEANGIAAPSSCRSGACGTCSTRLLAGTVTYDPPPLAEIAPGEVLICCARPGAEGAAISLEL